MKIRIKKTPSLCVPISKKRSILLKKRKTFVCSSKGKKEKKREPPVIPRKVEKKTINKKKKKKSLRLSHPTRKENKKPSVPSHSLQYPLCPLPKWRKKETTKHTTKQDAHKKASSQLTPSSQLAHAGYAPQSTRLHAPCLSCGRNPSRASHHYCSHHALSHKHRRTSAGWAACSAENSAAAGSDATK
jgi:hypothetical protein